MSNSNVDRCGIAQAVRQGTNRGKGKNAQEKGRRKERKSKQREGKRVTQRRENGIKTRKSKGKPRKTTAKMQKRKEKIWTFAQDSLYLQPNLENFIENYLILTLYYLLKTKKL